MNAHATKKLRDKLREMGFQSRSLPMADRNDGLMSDTKMNHWCVVLSRTTGEKTQSMQINYSKGVGLVDRLNRPEPPWLDEVIYSLVMDAQTFFDEQPSFDEWCREYGYDSDSIQALKIYEACKAQSEQFFKLVRDDETFHNLVELFEDY